MKTLKLYTNEKFSCLTNNTVPSGQARNQGRQWVNPHPKLRK